MSESNSSDPSSFLYVEMLAELLMRDTLEMEKHFNIQMQFIKDQEQKVLDNANNVISMTISMGSINCCMFKIEMELRENEYFLIETEKALTRLEQAFPKSDSTACRTYPLARATYQDLLSSLLSAESAAVQCNTLREEIEMYNKEASEKLPTKNVIAKIMDYHNYILLSLEKEIEKLQIEVTKVQREFEEQNRKQEASKNLPQCSCKNNDEVKPMDIKM